MNVATVQKQRGSDDCGVFAIAFALHAALGHCLEEIEFNQATMRDEPLKVLHYKKLHSFSYQESEKSPSYPHHEYRCVL